MISVQHIEKYRFIITKIKKQGNEMQELKCIWLFFQNQILGMEWLNESIGKILAMLGIDIDGKVGGSVQFFIYDVIKITILLCALSLIISYIQSYFPPQRSK